MTTTHTVAQGETLTRIAKLHSFNSYKTIYDHADNEAFRALRPDPNVIFPGDEIVIPEKENRTVRAATGTSHTFILKRPEKEKLIIVLQNVDDEWVGKRAILEVAGESLETEVASDDTVELELPTEGDLDSGILKFFLDPDIEEPSHQFEVKLGHLIPLKNSVEYRGAVTYWTTAVGWSMGLWATRLEPGLAPFKRIMN